MLVSGQLSSRIIIDDAQTLRKESRQLCHNSRNIMSISVLLKEVSEDLVTGTNKSVTPNKRKMVFPPRNTLQGRKSTLRVATARPSLH